MFRAILSSQWIASRLALGVCALTAFSIPVIAVQGAFGATPNRWQVMELLMFVQSVGLLLPLLAAGTGLAIAIAAWAPDHRGGHVYALSLPLQRSQYVLLRYAAGVVLLAAPVLALWIGSLVSVSVAVLSPGLQAYPTLLTLRFAFALLLSFSIFFAVASGTPRTAGLILLTIVAVIALQLLVSTFGGPDLLGPLVEHAFYSPGPLDVFGGNWMLIDA